MYGLEWIIDFAKDSNLVDTVLRIICSIVCGGAVGLERGKANQSAGMRTYILVCLGSTLVMLTGQYMYEVFDSGDPARLGAQVISGIGFLGAGSIIVEGHTKIKGLTTAAGLWAVACIGLAIGIGFYVGGITAAIAVYIVISKFRSISDRFTHNDMWMRIYIEFSSVHQLNSMYTVLESFGMEIGEVMINHPKNQENYNAIVCLKNHVDRSDSKIIDYLSALEGVDTVKLIY